VWHAVASHQGLIFKLTGETSIEIKVNYLKPVRLATSTLLLFDL
jgi:hypothetical protein